MGKKREEKKSSAEWFRPVLPVKKAQEKKIWRGECSNVPKKSKSGVGKKKSCVPCACGASMYPTNVDHQQNIFKIGNPSGEPGQYEKKKKKCHITKPHVEFRRSLCNAFFDGHNGRVQPLHHLLHHWRHLCILPDRCHVFQHKHFGVCRGP